MAMVKIFKPIDGGKSGSQNDRQGHHSSLSQPGFRLDSASFGQSSQLAMPE